MKEWETKIYDLRENMEENQNRFAMVENFVEKYQPVRVQNMIKETCNSFLTGKMKVDHEIFQKLRIEELNETILHDNGEPDLK